MSILPSKEDTGSQQEHPLSSCHEPWAGSRQACHPEETHMLNSTSCSTARKGRGLRQPATEALPSGWGPSAFLKAPQRSPSKQPGPAPRDHPQQGAQISMERRLEGGGQQKRLTRTEGSWEASLPHWAPGGASSGLLAPCLYP